MKVLNLLKLFIALLFLIVNINAQVVTNTATLYSSVTQADNTIVPSVPIPITIVRTNGRIAEISLNIGNVSQNAKQINLRVYELIYTTNVVESPLTNSTTTGGSTGGTTDSGTTGGSTGSTGGTTDGGTTGGTTGGSTGGSTGSTGGSTGGTISTNYVYVTNNVTLNVTLQTQTGTTNDVQIPAQTIWHNDKLENILFDITSLPTDAIILRFRILDYIYDENGNLVGPQGSGTNSGGTGTGGSGTGTGTGGSGTGGSGTGTGTGGSGTGGSGTGTGGGTISPPPPSADAVQFPVEVLGADQHTEEFKLVLNDNLNDIYGARFTIHGLGFTNKASVSINGSQWIPLNNRTVIFPRKFERIWVGIGGFQNTLTMVLPFASNNIIPSVTNTIKFKFNDITKQTVGYRVLNADIVRRQDTAEKEYTFGHLTGRYYTNTVYNYTPTTLATTKVIDDPKNWAPASSDPVVINQGKDLWFNGNISERGVALKAKCGDCHFIDGYDLKYFNYSDKSIVARSKYHGLSEQQGLALASYIRSLDVPYQEKGRPWNPLYQPGPGMSTVPIDNWAAGAGMDWVLDDDIKSFKYIFPNGTQDGIVYNGVVQPIDINKSYNIHDIPIAMQLPDWNHWLPKVHLKDSAPEIWVWSATKDGGSGRRFFDWFMGSIPKDQGMKGLVQIMRSYGEETGYQLVHMDQFFQKKYFDAGKQIQYMNDIRMAYRHWVTVRTFEIMQRWKMQDLGHDILEDNANTKDQWGERGARSYINLGKLDKIKAQFGNSYTNTFNDRRWFANTWPFHLAPHIGSLIAVTDQNNPNFTYEPYGDQSPQWYQLQMYLDDSNRMPEYNIVDWGYIHNFLWGGTSQWGELAKYSLYTGKHNALQFLNTLKSYEAYAFNGDYKGLLEGLLDDHHPHIRLLGGTVLLNADSSSSGKFNEFTMHYIDALHTKEKKDMMVGMYNQIHKIQIDVLEQNPQIADYNNLTMSENFLRYMGGDPNLIQKFVNFRKSKWPNDTWTSQIKHLWPQPFYPAL
jgi:hypothetical protein